MFNKNHNETEHAFKNTEENYNVWNGSQNIKAKDSKRELHFSLKMHERKNTTAKNQSKNYIWYLDEINSCMQIRRISQREIISIRLIRAQ